MVFLLPTEWCDYPREGSSDKNVDPLKVIGQLSCDSMVHLALAELAATRNFLLSPGRDTGLPPLNSPVAIFITHNSRILLHKAHLYKSIRFIFTCEKAYTANQNCVQLFHMWKYNQSMIA